MDGGCYLTQDTGVSNLGSALCNSCNLPKGEIINKNWYHRPMWFRFQTDLDSDFSWNPRLPWFEFIDLIAPPPRKNARALSVPAWSMFHLRNLKNCVIIQSRYVSNQYMYLIWTDLISSKLCCMNAGKKCLIHTWSFESCLYGLLQLTTCPGLQQKGWSDAMILLRIQKCRILSALIISGIHTQCPLINGSSVSDHIWQCVKTLYPWWTSK